MSNETNAKPIKTSGWKARALVQSKTNFKNHNGQLFGRWETPLMYAVYSYGDHWPLFVWDGFDWYENEEKFSVTTTKHRSQTHPLKETTLLNRNALRAMIAQRIGDHRQMERFQRSLLAA